MNENEQEFVFGGEGSPQNVNIVWHLCISLTTLARVVPIQVNTKLSINYLC